MAQVKITSAPGKALKHEVKAGAHKFVSDASKEHGGNEEGPNPHELLLAALGACTSMTLKLGAAKREWDLKNVQVELSDDTIEDPANPGKKITSITRTITVEGNLTAEQLDQLKIFADKCPVHKVLSGGGNKITTTLAAGQPSAS